VPFCHNPQFKLVILQRLHLIANPKGGVGDNLQIAKTAEEFLTGHGIETTLHVTERAGHAPEIVESLECGTGDAICGIGGDGTMHELVNGMMKRAPESRVPLALLPGGTGNSFLYDLDCRNTETVLNRLIEQTQRSIDLFEITVAGKKRYGFNIVAWGMASAANELAESLRVLGRRRYDIATFVKVLGNRKYRARLESDGETIDGGFAFVTLCNTVHTGEGMRIAPKADIADGKLDLIYIQEASRMQLIRLFSKLGKGDHVEDPLVTYLHTTRLKVTTEESVPITLDGELIESGSFEVKVLPGVLELLL
jgi:YegS/Rv2252/BmrU family lipid kinase